VGGLLIVGAKTDSTLAEMVEKLIKMVTRKQDVDALKIVSIQVGDFTIYLKLQA